MSGTERTRCWMLFKSQPTVSHPCRRQARCGPKAKPAHQMPALTATQAELQRERRSCSCHQRSQSELLTSSATRLSPQSHPHTKEQLAGIHQQLGGPEDDCALNAVLWFFFFYVFSSSAIVPRNWCGIQKQQVLLSNLCLSSVHAPQSYPSRDTMTFVFT